MVTSRMRLKFVKTDRGVSDEVIRAKKRKKEKKLTERNPLAIFDFSYLHIILFRALGGPVLIQQCYFHNLQSRNTGGKDRE
jgi:hypothetical protein